MLRRSLPFNFIKESKLGAGDVFHLLSEGTHSVEISSCRDVGILRLRHGFRHGDEIFLRPAKSTADALRNALRDFLLRCGRGRSYKDQVCENDESGRLHGATSSLAEFPICISGLRNLDTASLLPQ